MVTLGALSRRHKWAEMFWPFLIFPWALGQRFKCSVVKKDYFSHGKQGHGEQAFPGPDKSLSRRAVSVSFCRVTDHPKLSGLKQQYLRTQVRGVSVLIWPRCS